MTQGFAATAEQALMEAAIHAGLPEIGWSPIRIGERAVYRHDARGIIGKVARSSARFAAADREVRAARWLRQNGVPAEEPLELAQPTLAASLPVTFWTAVDGSWTTPDRLAAVLRDLHALDVPDELGLPPLDPIARMRQRLASSPGVSDDVGSSLAALIDEREAQFAGILRDAPQRLLHGDANIGNILVDGLDRTTLFDLDGLCVGPRQWDLMITAVYRDLGWHTDAEYRAFCDVYGADVTQDPAYPVLCSVQELRMVCWLAQQATEDAVVAEEFAMRVQDLHTPEKLRSWRPY